MVCPEHHSLAICGFQEIAELTVEQRAFRGAGDQRLPTVSTQRGNFILRVAVASALNLLGIPAGDVQDCWRTGNARSAETSSALGEQWNYEQQKEFFHAFIKSSLPTTRKQRRELMLFPDLLDSDRPVFQLRPFRLD